MKEARKSQQSLNLTGPTKQLKGYFYTPFSVYLFYFYLPFVIHLGV